MSDKHNLNVKLIWGYQIGGWGIFFLKGILGRGMMARHLRWVGLVELGAGWEDRKVNGQVTKLFSTYKDL